ncbi:MAG: DUF3160 domain-containing protein [Lachnospiraceae bacterium]|nr:DUF3160 domain-containing protein [Lachnospiraceae bacterium]
MMKKTKRKQIIALTLAVSLLSGCTAQKQTNEAIDTVQTMQSEEAETSVQTEQSEQASSADVTEVSADTERLYSGERPLLVQIVERSETESVVPCVEAYTVEPDLSNVDNLWQYYYLSDEMTQKLSQNGFVVAGNAGSEFFEIYEENRYMMLPSFVTVDSLMHTYHLYFSYLLKNLEQDFLSNALTQLSTRMLDNSIAQYGQLKGSEWESAAKRNVAFFTIGAKLLDDTAAVSEDVKEIVETELERINNAKGIDFSEITGDEEDYSQYIPRGYYEGDEKLERYFKAMMWYGRIHFAQEEAELDRSALLITKALADDGEAYALWESIYAVTSFFAGASDDLGVCEYAPLLREVYGEDITVNGLIGTEKAFEQFHAMTASLPAPQINSIPINDGEDNVIPGFRFMGQRFSIDAAVMQKLIYSNVEENSEGAKRMLPDVLDVPAALGSDTALRILEENGAADYAGYSENMELLRKGLAEENDTLWSASLYASWLNTLRPLLTVKGEGYPMFMQNEEWVKKDLECFAGSFTELKHDTILYSKQVMAEMGGGYDEEPDYRGYVQPEPLVYERFSSLAGQTAQGLKKYGMLDSADEENLTRLSEISDRLLTISNKELQDETLTDEEYEFIENYGGNLEHFWYEAVKGDGESSYIDSAEYPAALVVDIATDPNGTVLEAATGNPSLIYVVVKVDGTLKLARGSVYSFYQFPWPMDDRLTDTRWRQMMGLEAKEDGSYEMFQSFPKPEWTESYRYNYE